MPARLIPLVLTIEQANALIDVWEALQHSTHISESRTEKAFDTIEWLRVSLIQVRHPVRYSAWVRWRQEVRAFWRQRVLRWRNKHAVIMVALSREERVALLEMLELQKSTEQLYSVIEKVRLAREV